MDMRSAGVWPAIAGRDSRELRRGLTVMKMKLIKKKSLSSFRDAVIMSVRRLECATDNRPQEERVPSPALVSRRRQDSQPRLLIDAHHHLFMP